MKIWLFLQSRKPKLLWGLRIGNQWVTAKDIVVSTDMKTKFNKKAQPYAYLECEGHVKWHGEHAEIVG